MSNDIARIKATVRLDDFLSSRYGVELKWHGRSFVGCCPLPGHQDGTPSFHVYPDNKYHCYGGCDGGDIFDLIGAREGITDIPGKVRFIDGGDASRARNVAAKPRPKLVDPYEGIQVVDPLGAKIAAGQEISLYNPTSRKSSPFKVSAVYPYRRADGSLFIYILRHDRRDGGKDITPAISVRLPGVASGTWSRFKYPEGEQRPLYGLRDIEPVARIAVVEGEKCAEELRRVTRWTVVSWAGGTGSVAKTDWSPLYGREVLIWPDNDAAGLKAANDIAALLVDHGATVRVMNIAKAGLDLAKGWDCADAIAGRWKQTEIRDFIAATAEDWTPADNGREAA